MEIYVARQPIFDRNMDVYGYEVLYRSRGGELYDSTDGDQATRSVIANIFIHIGLNRITFGKKAFINFTQKLLLDDVGFNLPQDMAVIEILENVLPDQDIIQVCQKFKEAGYKLALDDFVITQEHLKPLVDMVDILKVDFMANKEKDRWVIAERLAAKGPKLLAEKVETREEWQLALRKGYTYFQGFFFSKPEIIQGKDIPGYKLNNLKLLQELNRKDVRFHNLEQTIKQDISLSYKLLNYMNSAYFGVLQQVSSVRQAMMLIGEDELRKWASLVILMGLGQDKPAELLLTSLIRAKFCESMAKFVGLEGAESEVYMMGLLSLLDVLIGQPLNKILSEIPLNQDIKAALTTGDSPYSNLFALVRNYERANWQELGTTLEHFNLKMDTISGSYLNSVEYAEKLLQR